MVARPTVKTLTPSEGTSASDSAVASLRTALANELQGKDAIIDRAIACYIAGGHLLLEGPPGTGKTSLAKALAGALGGTFNRIQMTSDLLPSDVVGIIRLNAGQNEFEFREGPIFANFVLADELNRTPPKTQGALLEAMEEGTVSVDRRTYTLPQPFFLIATQNPMEFHGVYPLAESQLDRFMLQLNFDPPSEADELNIYRSPAPARHAAPSAAPVLTLPEALALRGRVDEVHVEQTVLEYLTRIVRETRTLPGVAHGVSVRGGLQFLAVAKGFALVQGRTFVTPDDVRTLAPSALAHRLMLTEAESTTTIREQMILELLKKLPTPK